uniref:Tf2-1-like SH3-like domain-containing protein n=1 Tax=Cajanus cajan TaxID=3821 RepID=A0A151RTT4_CAJCA|nr:hypothetical protein KK1_032491 [Cajanus cajan]
MKANRHRREVTLEVGDMVLVLLQPYRQSSVSQGRHHKLCKRFYGPFPVLERVGQVAYRVGLPAESRIHPVFHISVLKLFQGQMVSQTHDLLASSFDNKPIKLPVAICASRTVLNHGITQKQVLVQWEGHTPEEATWEPFSEFCSADPALHLEDKVNFEGEENDTVHNQALPIELGHTPMHAPAEGMIEEPVGGPNTPSKSPLN